MGLGFQQRGTRVIVSVSAPNKGHTRQALAAKPKQRQAGTRRGGKNRGGGRGDANQNENKSAPDTDDLQFPQNSTHAARASPLLGFTRVPDQTLYFIIWLTFRRRPVPDDFNLT